MWHNGTHAVCSTNAQTAQLKSAWKDNITPWHTSLENHINFVNQAEMSVLHQNNTGDTNME
jgi:hypothetical protein